MSQEAIKNFSEQLKYQPEIENQDAFEKRDKFIVVGMGGSNLASGLLKVWKPEMDIVIHRDFGLPAMAEDELQNRSVIISSYSGGTEEAIDVFREALKKKLSVIILTAGGELLELAKESGVPYIQMPKIGAHPRLAVGLSMKAMLKAMDEKGALEEVTKLAGSLNAADYQNEGKDLAGKLEGKIPVVYSSNRNLPIAYYWKVSFNETSKVPAFCAAFPELNHNEMVGFASAPKSQPLSEKFHFVLLKDIDDDLRIQKRIEATKKLYEERGLGVEMIDLTGDSEWQKILGSVLTAAWASYHLARNYGINPEDTAVLENFKKSVS